MMTYLLKTHICLSIFLMIYWGFLRKTTFYQLNRSYFLLAIIGSIALPLLDISDFVNQHQEINRVEVVKYIPDLSFRVDSQLVIEQKMPLTSISNPKIYFNFFDIFQAIFLSGIVVLLYKLIVQIISIFRFLNISTPQIINKIKVRNLSSDVSPFSFFNYIFININKHSEEDLSEIIAHESAHVRQFHSVDVMMIELFCMLFWVNPLAWIMRKFLKQNLEFLTDETVLNHGFEVRHYQYNLLKISGLIPIAVTNNFNFSDLKLRIKMMNKKRSSKLHLLKYFLTIPLGAVLILAFNISKAKPFDVHKSVMENVKEMVKSVEFEPVILKNDGILNKETLKKNIENSYEENYVLKSNETIYTKNDSLKRRNYSFSTNINVIDNETQKGVVDVQIYNHKGELLGKTNSQGISIIDFPESFRPITQDSIKVVDRYVRYHRSYHKIILKYKLSPDAEMLFTSFQKTVNLIFDHGKIIKAPNKEFSNSVVITEEDKKNGKGSAIITDQHGNLLITPKTKWFYCKEDIIKELERTQVLPTEKCPIYKINGTIVATNYNWNDVSIHSILNLEYWSPEDGEKLISQYGESARNGIYNLNVLVKQTIAQKGDNELPFIKPEKNLPKMEKCTPSIAFPTNALYIIDGKIADSGYLHKNVKPDEIDKLEVMEIELAKTKYGEKGKSGVILISTKKINKLGEK